MSNPIDRLHHWYLALLADPEYEGVCKRIGLAATRAEFNDPERRFDPNDLAWMEGFCSALRNGVFPEATALCHTANAFTRYLRAEGAVSLDEAFGLTSRQRSGNPSTERAKGARLGRYFMAMFERRRDHRDETNLQLAEHAIKALGQPPFGVETLARYFGDWCSEHGVDLTLDDEPT